MAEFVLTYRELTAWILFILATAGLITVLVIQPWCDCTTEASTTQPSTNPAPNQTEEEPENQPVPEGPSCSDDEQNQDESDVDCGGVCPQCGLGDSCDTNSDCKSNRCVGGECRQELQLSGDVDFTIERVDYTRGESTSSKVTAITVEVTNGLDENIKPRVDLWAIAPNGVFYLNQIEDDQRDENTPYASVTLTTITPGDTYTRTLDVDGSYLYSITGQYEQDDDFIIEAYLMDGREELATDEITVNVG